jgi:hypothetical protein
MSSRMMRAARVLSVETDTAYTLRVRKQPAQLHVRMDAVPECWVEHVDHHGESPMAHGLTSGILVYYSGDSTPRFFDSGITKITVEPV